MDDDIYVDGKGLNATNFHKPLDLDRNSAISADNVFTTDVTFNGFNTHPSFLNVIYGLKNIFQKKNKDFESYWVEDDDS